MSASPEAVLMVNVGSPDAPTVPAVRRYLREFLSDPRIIDLPGWQRWLLVNLIILPTRPKKSAHAYQQVWRPEGSPLAYFSQRQRDALEQRLRRPVLLAMGYGNPALPKVLAGLDGVQRLTVLPMFPHYASATVGSVLEGVYTRLAQRPHVPAVKVVPPFWSSPGFLDAQAELIRSRLGDAEQLVLSYHGLPERQVRAADAGCLRSDACCDRLPAGCYRAQCLATSRELAARLPGVKLSAAFQSRLGRDRWLGPASDVHVAELAKSGVRRIAVACPSFVADCLETLEEVGLRLRDTFLQAGGSSFTLVPCVNDSPTFIDGLAQAVEAA
ncbi:MAG: ferrochelatase [Myxococcaceae bacterium]|nr:ferrochelatase [Myxococcaceae bacterium]